MKKFFEVLSDLGDCIFFILFWIMMTLYSIGSIGFEKLTGKKDEKSFSIDDF